MKYKHTNRDNNEKFIDIIWLIVFEEAAWWDMQRESLTTQR